MVPNFCVFDVDTERYRISGVRRTAQALSALRLIAYRDPQLPGILPGPGLEGNKHFEQLINLTDLANHNPRSSDVKSYADVQITNTDQLSSVSSIPSTWHWSYTGSNIVADVSYDMFTSSSKGGSAQYEIMVWLAALGGAGPISSTGSPVATPNIDGVTWKLYSGPNGATTVYSFVAESEQTSFSGDLKSFFTYLSSNEGYSLSQYLISISAGTEVFTYVHAAIILLFVLWISWLTLP